MVCAAHHCAAVATDPASSLRSTGFSVIDTFIQHLLSDTLSPARARRNHRTLTVSVQEDMDGLTNPGKQRRVATPWRCEEATHSRCAIGCELLKIINWLY